MKLYTIALCLLWHLASGHELTPGSLSSCPVLGDAYDAFICDYFECTDSCEDPGKLCCQNKCGSRLCVDGPCTRAVMNLTSGAERLDQFVPECSYDGTFHPLQCWSDYCWCVDRQSGENISNAVTYDRFEELDCLGCQYGDHTYDNGEKLDDCCGCSYSRIVCADSHDCGYYVDEPTPGSFFSCPVLEDGAVGLCVNLCWNDSDCNSGQKCCKNNCGALTCMNSLIPHLSPPRECPEEFDPVICDSHECTDSCEDPGKLCCQNECGSSLCVDGEIPPNPCTRAVMNLTSGAERLDQFVPECSYADGTFHPLQCWSDHCWCVDKQSGEPISNAVTYDRIEELDCLVCQYGNQTYENGERFGCCRCSRGHIVCARSADGCGYYVDDHVNVNELEWWHISLIATAAATVSIIVISALLTVVIVMLIKRFCPIRKKQRESPEMLSIDPMTTILDKNGLPEAESTEFKVPIEDDDGEPVKT